ncbi:hypothetical protein BH09MYX1_BH09MYX1_17550 [soil metagenome]
MTRTLVRNGILALAMTLASGATGCDKKTEGDPGAASANASANASAAAAASAAASASAAAAAIAAGAPRTFKGTYTATRASYYLPDSGEYSGVKFRGDDAGDALGDGPLTITIDKDGNVTGEGDGPLGPFTIAGIERDGDATFSLRRKDPNDTGATGTGVATLEAKSLDGTLRVSAYRAQIIREVTFKLAAQ